MQIIASVYMLFVALNLLNIHPIFRYAILQPPRFLTKLVSNQSKSKEIFAPALLGVLTIFIPCGTTLAMEALAISSGSPLIGAVIMGVFTLGTSPLFFGLGFLTTILGDAFRTKFLKIAAIGLIYLGITSFNGALLMAGSPINLQAIGEAIPISIDFLRDSNLSENNVKEISGVQIANIEVFPTGYSPNYIKVKQGVPVKLNLTPVGGFGCTAGFIIPSLGIRENLSQGTTASIEFTPTQKGKIVWSCTMGMYRGVIEVI